ncbi:hypothetical protein A1OE_780 [Candidatus Endolissoclinum faulkneri L2]|uniref:Uncharacterized protein n=1 Tax=Candidatus Endolissoclinum faulkneri L2 TaxID=1193729 RepID=K7YHE6_9PROT|nr:hypothetical protein A1OE_780 [Candidatus Endolissoclinum faulkneri L2]
MRLTASLFTICDGNLNLYLLSLNKRYTQFIRIIVSYSKNSITALCMKINLQAFVRLFYNGLLLFVSVIVILRRAMNILIF